MSHTKQHRVDVIFSQISIDSLSHNRMLNILGHIKRKMLCAEKSGSPCSAIAT